MEVKIPVSIGELFDKITILDIKSRKITDLHKLKNVNNELTALQNVVKQIGIVIPDSLYNELFQVNLDLWNLEDKIREKEELMQFDDEFITFARGDAIYNDKRFLVKKKINDHFNSSIVEEKSYSKEILDKHQSF